MTIDSSTYTGIGSRETPHDVLHTMENIAYRLSDAFNLRSGAAPGADSAFEHGANQGGGGVSLFLPWPNFERRDAYAVGPDGLFEPHPAAFPIAEHFHPAWNQCSPGAKKLHARNVHQILGRDINSPMLPICVICWTKNGSSGGGTGQALRIARHYGVTVYDLALDKHRTELNEFFEEELA